MATTASTWRYGGHATGADAAEARRAAAALERPLRLERRGLHDPAESWMGWGVHDIPDVVLPVLGAGPREAFKFEMLPWGWIDNRPFLRALHGLAVTRWRLRQFDEARRICESLLWLNPDDNQGVRDIIDVIDRRLDWLPHDSFT